MEVGEFIEQYLHKVAEAQNQEILGQVEYEEGHSSRPTEDINFADYSGWFIGRIDGLQAVKSKLKGQGEGKV